MGTKATLRSRFWRDMFNNLRHCPSCGGGLKIQYVKDEKSKRHVCVVCRRITYLNPKIVAGLIPVGPQGEIYLLRRAIEPGYGLWSYPAGYMEIGETIQAAAERETFEEIRARVKSVSFLNFYSYADAGVVTMVFWGRLLGKNKPTASHEALEVKAFRPEQIPWKKLAFRSVREALRDFCALK